MARLCVALDTETEKALKLLDKLSDYPLIFKVGHKLFIPEGKRIINEIKDRGFEVFLDLKFHDIPNTVALAVKSAEQLGVDYLTVHSLGGGQMLKRAVEEAAHVKVLGVSVLTSHGKEYLRFLRTGFKSVREMVMYLAEVCVSDGVHGIVCSAEEVGDIKERFGDRLITVVPGIRFSKENAQDQKRVLTPGEAVRRGADILVMGREIINSPEPESVVERVLKSING